MEFGMELRLEFVTLKKTKKTFMRDSVMMSLLDRSRRVGLKKP